MMFSITPSPSKPLLNVLVSYSFWTKSIQDVLERQDHSQYRLMIDSGAWSAYNSGKIINMNEYLRFLDSIAHLQPFEPIQLDVVYNHEKTVNNFYKLQSLGYDVMPVFTRGSPLEWLDEAYRHKNYVCFGGIVAGSGNIPYVRWFSEKNKGRPVHWLGFGKSDQLKRYKPTSFDTSAWIMCGIYGNVHVYLGVGDVQSVSEKKLKHGDQYARRLLLTVDKFKLPRSIVGHLRKPESWRGGIYVPGGSIKGVSTYLSLCANLWRCIEMEQHIGVIGYMGYSSADKLEQSFDLYSRYWG